MVIVYQTNDPGGIPFYKTYKTYMYVQSQRIWFCVITFWKRE